MLHHKDEDDLCSKSLYIQLGDKHVVLLVLHLVNIAPSYGNTGVSEEISCEYHANIAVELVSVGIF